MKFKRADLIGQVRKAIQLRQEYAAQRTEDAVEAAAKSRTKYLEDTSGAWAELAATIQARLAAGEPMAASDVPRLLRNGYTRGHLETYDPSPPTVYRPDTRDLESLLSLLEAATDEEITTSSLERMGFRTAKLISS